MTDLERIELACRRIADRERAKLKLDGTFTDAVHLDVIKIFDLLATELAALHKADAFPSRCPHGKWMTEECSACNGTMFHRYIVSQK